MPATFAKARTRRARVRRKPRIELLEPRVLLAGDWQNPLNELDVNDDGVWDHPIESIGPSLSLAAGDNTVTFELPDEVALGQLATRLSMR